MSIRMGYFADSRVPDQFALGMKKRTGGISSDAERSLRAARNLHRITARVSMEKQPRLRHLLPCCWSLACDVKAERSVVMQRSNDLIDAVRQHLGCGSYGWIG